MRRKLLLLLFCAIAAGAALADEPVRRVQEELRKRNFFFGDVDGKMSPELSGALRGYQSHKGFEPTGQIDEVTARSLHVEIGETTARPPSTDKQWPDVPVLKSDAARDLPPQKQAELEKAAAAGPDASPTPDIPGEGPAEPRNLDPKRVRELVENYLRDGETDNIAAQLDYYAYPVDYFNHGPVGQKFVEKDNRNYIRRWPIRKYTLTGPVTLAAGPNEGETKVKFPISFRVQNSHYHAEGRTQNFWTIKPQGGAVKIVAIREQHVRE